MSADSFYALKASLARMDQLFAEADAQFQKTYRMLNNLRCRYEQERCGEDQDNEDGWRW